MQAILRYSRAHRKGVVRPAAPQLPPRVDATRSRSNLSLSAPRRRVGFMELDASLMELSAGVKSGRIRQLETVSAFELALAQAMDADWNARLSRAGQRVRSASVRSSASASFGEYFGGARAAIELA